jgi:hypothetical protein
MAPYSTHNTEAKTGVKESTDCYNIHYLTTQEGLLLRFIITQF